MTMTITITPARLRHSEVAGEVVEGCVGVGILLLLWLWLLLMLLELEIVVGRVDADGGAPAAVSWWGGGLRGGVELGV